jgi:hypothetical protein
LQGSLAWTAVTITRATLDGWRMEAAAGAGARLHCRWSLDLPLALARLSGVSTSVALRVERAGDGAVVLCAAKHAGRGGTPDWRLALALVRLPDEHAGSHLTS